MDEKVKIVGVQGRLTVGCPGRIIGAKADGDGTCLVAS